MLKSQTISSMVVNFQEVDESSEGQRLDNYLIKKLKSVPKSKIYRIIRKGEVRVNKGRCKPDTRLKQGDVVRIPPLQFNSVSATETKVPGRLLRKLKESTLFEDDGLLIINKPEGIAVHGGSGLSFGMIEALREARPEHRFLELVHRLDRDTSGVLMLAKKRTVLVELHRMLQTGRVRKTYHAWVSGHWPLAKPVITAPLRKNVLRSGERVVIVAADGKPSETRIEPLLQGNECSLIKVSPQTGRTHQIRVHCQFAGHPILGDEKYCPDEINQKFRNQGLKRMCLHAYSLELVWMNRKTQVVTAPWTLGASPVG